ncbi:MAG: hypothetical protein IJ958_01435, partial [Agathobacter sp.]|nr:hypothetical protein [Agathobacter sp.]
CYYYLAEYEDVIAYADTAIKYSMNNYIMRHFQIILDYKARALYHMDNIEESCKLFNTALNLYQMDSGYEDYIIHLKEIISADFPRIQLL